MNKNLKDYINQSEVPPYLKHYLTKTNHAHTSITKKVIDDIELIYLEFDTLYTLDESEFRSIIIKALYREDKYTYFYYYIKNILKIIYNVTSEDSDLCFYELYIPEDVNKNLKDYINQSEVPSYLKHYLTKTNHTHTSITKKVIDDIELIYLELDTLYTLDESEFRSIIIKALYREDKYSFFYYYVKSILKRHLL